MRLVPARRFSIDSPLAPDDAAARLAVEGQ